MYFVFWYQTFLSTYKTIIDTVLDFNSFDERTNYKDMKDQNVCSFIASSSK